MVLTLGQMLGHTSGFMYHDNIIFFLLVFISEIVIPIYFLQRNISLSLLCKNRNNNEAGKMITTLFCK